MNPSRAEYLLRKLPEFYETTSLAALPGRMVQLLTELVPGNLVAYNEVDLKHSRARLELSEREMDFGPLIKAFEAHLHEHPLIQHQQATQDLSPRKISDFRSVAQFHRLGLYQELYRRIGCEDQIALALRSNSTHVIALAINRERRSFTAEDLEVLRLAQPHLMRVHQNALAGAALQRQLATFQALLETLPLALLQVGARGQLEFASVSARDLLRRYFPHQPLRRKLPAPIQHWLSTADQCEGAALPAVAGKTWRVTGGEGTLTLRCLAGNGPTRFLLLEESPAELSPQPLQSLGLTRRESEVLFWVAQGKSNADIGVILGNAPRTVAKHVENLLAKIGVETRTAAAQRAWEVLRR